MKTESTERRATRIRLVIFNAIINLLQLIPMRERLRVVDSITVLFGGLPR